MDDILIPVSVGTSEDVTPRTTFRPSSNNEDLVSDAVHFWVRSILPGVVTPILSLFGVPANVLCAVVFCKHSLKERINVCLFALALSDFIAVAVQLLLAAEQVYRSFIGPCSVFLETLVGPTGFIWASQFVSTVIACERCFCVVSPFKAQKYLKTSTMAVFVTVSCVVLVGGICVIAGYKHTAVVTFDPASNKTTSVIGFTKFYLDHKDVFDPIAVFFYSAAFPFIIFVVIVCTTYVTIRKIYSAMSWRHSVGSATEAVGSESSKPASTELSSKEVALTKMLIGTSVFFIICLVPNVMYHITIFLVPDFSYSGKYYNLHGVVWEIVSHVRLMNCSLNFIIYYRMGSKFRATVQEMLFCRRLPDTSCKQPLSEKVSSLSHTNSSMVAR